MDPKKLPENTSFPAMVNHMPHPFLRGCRIMVNPSMPEPQLAPLQPQQFNDPFKPVTNRSKTAPSSSKMPSREAPKPKKEKEHSNRTTPRTKKKKKHNEDC